MKVGDKVEYVSGDWNYTREMVGKRGVIVTVYDGVNSKWVRVEFDGKEWDTKAANLKPLDPAIKLAEFVSELANAEAGLRDAMENVERQKVVVDKMRAKLATIEGLL